MSETRKKLIFLGLFSLISFLTLQIPFTKLAGSDISFTLFDFFAPIAGVFLGPILGVVSVLAVELINFFFKQTPITTASIIRLIPMLFATYYFAIMSRKKQSKLILLFPILSIILFIAHPIGRSVWYYSLFWIIPLIAYFKKDNLFLRSLGSTFTAHAVGGAAWIWALNLPANVWNSLIPIVAQERLLFALGITVSFLVTKFLVNLLVAKKILPKISFVS